MLTVGAATETKQLLCQTQMTESKQLIIPIASIPLLADAAKLSLHMIADDLNHVARCYQSEGICSWLSMPNSQNSGFQAWLALVTQVWNLALALQMH